jgi:hypothetical protein
MATARLQTPASQARDRDARSSPHALRWSARDALALALAAAIVALMIVALGHLLTQTSSDAPAVTPDEVFVVNPDDKEPFILCTERAGVRRCAPMEVGPAQP